MTVVVFPVEEETDALVEMLRDQTAAGIYKAGDVYKTGDKLTFPYAVLHRITDQLVLPSMVEDGSGFRSVWQFDADGLTQVQAESLMTLLAGWLLESNGAGGWANEIPVADWACIRRGQIAGLGTTPEGQPQRKTWVCRRRFELVWDLA